MVGPDGSTGDGKLTITGMTYSNKNFNVAAKYDGTFVDGKDYSIVIRTAEGVLVASTEGKTNAGWEADGLVWKVPYAAVSGVGSYQVTVTIDGVVTIANVAVA